ncbi:alpha-2-macroglobulin family protein, partial [Pseudomonas sp. GW6]
LRSLFDRRSEARSGLPLVQLAAALKLMGDAPRAEQVLNQGLIQQRDGERWMADYGSPLRDQALILALLEEHGLAAGQREQRLFNLADELAGQRWLSTQERNALFLAGRGILGKPEQTWSAALTSGTFQFELSNQQPGIKLERGELAEPLSVNNAGSTKLYQQLTLSGYPSQAPRAGGENLSIEREYLGMDGRPLDLQRLDSGELVLVHLAVRAKQRVPDALVVDLLPAGLELENQNLAQSAASLDDAGSNVKEWRRSMQNARIKHQEYLGDRYVAAVDVEEYGTTHLLYLARAVTPGSYRVPPPQVESMYRPSWQALGTAPESLVVRGR